ncbi:MAG: N-acetylmuramoyl-L-alanine amidase [Clostridia bacterium]
MVIKGWKLLVVAAALIVIPLGIIGTNYVQKAYSPRPIATVVIDAGHGGVDGGVEGVKTGVFEREINLIISKLLAKRLESVGVTAILTRKTKSGLYESIDGNFKLKDFERRKEIILNANPSAVVSIHCNKYSSPSRRGIQVFFDGTNDESRAFGNIMQEGINKNLNLPYTHRGYSALSGDYYIVKCTNAPSIIIECGFLSNVEDEKLLVDSKYREILTYHIFSGIMQYIATA